MRQGVHMADLGSATGKLPLLAFNRTKVVAGSSNGAGLTTLQLVANKNRGMCAAVPQDRIERIAAGNAVVVFSKSGCCMCHVVKKLFCGMGVSPMLVELDQETDGGALEKALVEMVGERPALPAIFVGGTLLGGLDRLIAAHISGTLIPQLKAAGALWL